MSKKLHWKPLAVLVGVPWLVFMAIGLCCVGGILGLAVPCILIGGMPYFFVMGVRYLLGLNPYMLHGSIVWMVVVGFLYLVFLGLLAGVVRFQSFTRRMWCVAAVVAFGIFAFWGFSIWAGQSC